MPQLSFKERAEANSKLPCQNCGVRNRNSIGRLCGNCQNYHTLLGNPSARMPKLKNLKPWIEEAHRIIALNADHPGIKLALESLQEWHRQAKANPVSVPSGKWLCRLPEEALPEILNVWAGASLYNSFDPQTVLCRDNVALYYFCVKVLCSFEPFPQGSPMRWNRQKSEDRRQTALLIARQYSPILRSFVDAKLAEEKERERRMEVMLQPLRFQS